MVWKMTVKVEDVNLILLNFTSIRMTQSLYVCQTIWHFNTFWVHEVHQILCCCYQKCLTCEMMRVFVIAERVCRLKGRVIIHFHVTCTRGACRVYSVSCLNRIAALCWTRSTVGCSFSLLVLQTLRKSTHRSANVWWVRLGYSQKS